METNGMTQAKKHNLRNRARRLLRGVGYYRNRIAQVERSDAPNKADQLRAFASAMNVQESRLGELREMGFAA